VLADRRRTRIEPFSAKIDVKKRRLVTGALNVSTFSIALRLALLDVFLDVAVLLSSLARALLKLTLGLLRWVVGHVADSFIDLAFTFSAVPFTWSLFMVILLAVMWGGCRPHEALRQVADPVAKAKKSPHAAGFNPYQWRHGGDELSINPNRQKLQGGRLNLLFWGWSSST
jgi:hypothetical protein